MSYQALDPDKTAVLFFDMLNRYHTNDEPLVLNCVRLRDAADDHGIPVFFAAADHRPDGEDAAMLFSAWSMASRMCSTSHCGCWNFRTTS